MNALKLWLLALRPLSFTAAIIPVLAGTAVVANDEFRAGLFVLALLGSVALQGGTSVQSVADTVPGQIVILNGAPRSGKSSIAEAIQESFDGVWMNLGVDTFFRATAPRYRPGIGLRPGPGPTLGGDRPDLEPLVPTLYAAMYDSIAAHIRLGINVVVDVGHHGAIHPTLLHDCARRLAGLPVLFVGVRCPIEVIMERRHVPQPGREQMYERGTPEEPIPPPVQLWQDEVHKPGIYDLEVDTSQLTPDQCAEAIRARLTEGPCTAFPRLAEM